MRLPRYQDTIDFVPAPGLHERDNALWIGADRGEQVYFIRVKELPPLHLFALRKYVIANKLQPSGEIVLEIVNGIVNDPTPTSHSILRVIRVFYTKSPESGGEDASVTVHKFTALFFLARI
jgi:hypothetical protein